MNSTIIIPFLFDFYLPHTFGKTLSLFRNPNTSNCRMTSLASDPQAAAHVQSCLKELYKLIKNVEDARKGSEPTLSSITATHKKVESEQKITPNNKARLKSLYDDAIKESSKVRIIT